MKTANINILPPFIGVLGLVKFWVTDIIDTHIKSITNRISNNRVNGTHLFTEQFPQDTEDVLIRSQDTELKRVRILSRLKERGNG